MILEAVRDMPVWMTAAIMALAIATVITTQKGSSPLTTTSAN